MSYIVVGGKHVLLYLLFRYLNSGVVFSALRVFALWDRSWVLASFVLFLNMIPFVINTVSLSDVTYSVLRIVTD